MLLPPFSLHQILWWHSSSEVYLLYLNCGGQKYQQEYPPERPLRWNGSERLKLALKSPRSTARRDNVGDEDTDALCEVQSQQLASSSAPQWRIQKGEAGQQQSTENHVSIRAKLKHWDHSGLFHLSFSNFRNSFGDTSCIKNSLNWGYMGLFTLFLPLVYIFLHGFRWFNMS